MVRCCDQSVFYLQVFFMQQAGARRVTLHGCVGECKKKVWGPNDPSTVCDLCGADRFDAAGKPKEFIIHFPLMDQFKSLLTCKQYQQTVRWECLRPTQNAAYMCGNCYLYLHVFPIATYTYLFTYTHCRCLRLPLVARVNGTCLPRQDH